MGGKCPAPHVNEGHTLSPAPADWLDPGLDLSCEYMSLTSTIQFLLYRFHFPWSGLGAGREARRRGITIQLSLT